MQGDRPPEDEEQTEALARLREAEIEDQRAQRELKRQETALLEGIKLHYDRFKTQATLTTGAIIAASAIVQGLLPPDLIGISLLWGSYISLLFSMITSLAAMSILVNATYKLPRLSERSDAEKRAQSIAWWIYGIVSTISFSGGIFVFIIFAALNLLGS